MFFTRSFFKRFFLLAIVLAIGLSGLNVFDRVYSANLTAVSVTVSTPRLSYYGNVAAGNTVGSSVVYVNTSGSPSTSVANLFTADIAKIGYHNYTVDNLDDANNAIQIDSGLVTPDNEVTSAVIATRSASLAVGFTSASAIASGRFRVLVPSATTNTAGHVLNSSYTDGIPDALGWDFTDNTSNITVTCPSNGGGFTFGSPTKTAGAVVIAGQTYHEFTCPYTGVGSVGNAMTMSVDGLINPAPASGHTIGTADQYRIIVQNQDSSNNTIDQTTAAVAMIESVRITASVDPQITFSIAGVAASTAVCNLTTSVTSTATLVPLGSLAINSFRSAAQLLTVATNANNGYVVTAVDSDQLKRPSVASCTGHTGAAGCIPDSAGDSTGMSPVNADEWTSTATKGFAYTLAQNSIGGSTTLAFQYNVNSGGGNCGTNTDCFRQFADNENSENPEPLFQSTDVADNESVYVCYKAVVSPTQAAASDYQTDVTYRATATF